MSAILMTEAHWRCSPLSIARHYGSVSVKAGNERIEYAIVNKEGKDIYECSAEAEKAGREYAIEPGEPADLVDRRYVPVYREIGREAFIRMISEYEDLTPQLAKELAKEYKQLNNR